MPMMLAWYFSRRETVLRVTDFIIAFIILVIPVLFILKQPDLGTSLLISAHDRAGALLEILEPFAKHKISLTSIETRPALPEKWAYVFFIDLEGHIDQENVAAALDEIRPIVKELRVLGSYPIAVL